MKIYLLAFLTGVASVGAEIPNQFFRALHQVETSGRFGAIKGDNGKALGPFQIHKVYWLDAMAFDRTIGGRYEDCSDYLYSQKVVNAYLLRYAKAAVAIGDVESLARIHNGGPTGYKRNSTIPYWNKVKKNL